ncbi:MAG: hypothetical protein AAFQ94_01070 [Bacteroidota bacterium]
MNHTIRQPNQFLMLAFGLIFTYIIIDQAGDLIFYCITLIFYQLEFYPLEIGFIVGSLYEIVLIVIIIVLLIRVYQERLAIPTKFFETSTHKKLLASAIGLFVITILFKYTYDQLVNYLGENSLRSSWPFSTVGEKITYISLIGSGLGFIQKLIMVSSYMVLIRKESTKDR